MSSYTFKANKYRVRFFKTLRKLFRKLNQDQVVTDSQLNFAHGTFI